MVESELPLIGAKLALFASSPASSVLGIAVPLVAGIQAARDLLSGKIPSAVAEDPSYEDVKRRRERLRESIVRICVVQILVAVIDLALIGWIFVVSEIPKSGTTPLPDVAQSIALIALAALTALAIALEMIRLYLTSKLEKTS